MLLSSIQVSAVGICGIPQSPLGIHTADPHYDREGVTLQLLPQPVHESLGISAQPIQSASMNFETGEIV